MGPPASYRVSRVRYYSGATRLASHFAYGNFTLFVQLFQNCSAILRNALMWSATPENKSSGLASFPFARRYLGNRCFFLLLKVLRCFSSLRSLCMVMYWPYSDRGLLCQVSPFGYLRVKAYLQLTVAFRSLSRPSSALGAKASTLRS